MNITTFKSNQSNKTHESLKNNQIEKQDLVKVNGGESLCIEMKVSE